MEEGSWNFEDNSFLWKQTQDTISRIKEIAALLEEVSKKSKDLTSPQHNLIRIAPHVMAEFHEVKTKSLPISKIITLFSNWTDDLYETVMENLFYYTRNKKVREHINAMYDICAAFEKIAAKYLDKKE